jgi:parallel beta-helix repeat protein
MTWGLLAVTLILFWLLIVPVGAAPAVTLTVCPAGPPDCDYTIIQDAVNAANDGDTIKVAAGLYTDVHDRTAPAYYEGASTITQMIYINKSITLQGGYNASNFGLPPTPDITPSILDVGGQGRILFIGGSISPTIEGVRMLNGNANGLGGGAAPFIDAGGGVYVYGTTATISNCIVSGGTAEEGGGLYLKQSDAILTRNSIVGSSAERGGGLHLLDSPVWLNGNAIKNNHATGGGGGIYLDWSDATLSDNVISNNTTYAFTGLGGAGVFLEGGDATFTANTIRNNDASAPGGGLYIYHGDATLNDNTIVDNIASYGGGLRLEYKSHVTLYGNNISRNQASHDGGGLWVSSIVTLTRNAISDNSADEMGGGMRISGDVVINSNHIYGNSAGINGGGVFIPLSHPTIFNTIIANNQANNQGSGLYIERGSVQVLHTTFVQNLGGKGSGIYVTNDYYDNPSSITMSNTILVGHSVGISVTSGSTATLEATLWGADNWANGIDWEGVGSISTGSVNIWGDPGFTEPLAGDYHLAPNSAAIEAGINTEVITDIDGQERPRGCHSDIGADEYPGLPPIEYLRTIQAIADPAFLTVTLAWSAPENAITYTLCISSSPIDAENWTSATILSDSIPGSTTMYTATVPWSDGTAFFALKWYACGDESSVSRNTFWPRWDLYLPAVFKNH